MLLPLMLLHLLLRQLLQLLLVYKLLFLTLYAHVPRTLHRVEALPLHTMCTHLVVTRLLILLRLRLLLLLPKRRSRRVAPLLLLLLLRGCVLRALESRMANILVRERAMRDKVRRTTVLQHSPFTANSRVPSRDSNGCVCGLIALRLGRGVLLGLTGRSVLLRLRRFTIGLEQRLRHGSWRVEWSPWQRW